MDIILNLLEQYNLLIPFRDEEDCLFDKFSIVHHSCLIEGSTLTKSETELLLFKGVISKEKPILHSLMEQDNYKALLFTLDLAKNNKNLLIKDLQIICGLTMNGTGEILNTALGTVDASKGDFRKSNVSSGNSYFMNYDKVENYTNKLLNLLNENYKTVTSDIDKLILSFQAHYELVTIHPFLDGNGRTARLLMNYFQRKFNLPLSIVFSEGKVEYIQALNNTRKNNDFEIFKKFMFLQYKKQLEQKISSALH